MDYTRRFQQSLRNRKEFIIQYYSYNVQLLINSEKQAVINKLTNLELKFSHHAILRLKETSRVYSQEEIIKFLKSSSSLKTEIFIEKENIYHCVIVLSKRKAIDVVFKINGYIFILTIFPLGRKSLLKLSKKWGLNYGKI